MNKDEKEGLIGLVIIAAVLLVGGYFIYKNFFTYGSYAECVGDRTSEPGLSNLQVKAQKDYCRSYFAKKTKPKTAEEIKKETEILERRALQTCVDRFGNWGTGLGRKDDYGKQVNCANYKYIFKKCIAKTNNGNILYLSYPHCKK